MIKISISEGAKFFLLSYIAFWKRLKKEKYKYPKVYKSKEGKMFLNREEVEKVASFEIDFLKKHISVNEVSQLLFGNTITLNQYLKRDTYCFLPVETYCEKQYLNKDKFYLFFADYCDNKKLVPHKVLYNLLCGYGFYSKLSYDIIDCEEFKKIRKIRFTSDSNARVFYNINDLNCFLTNKGFRKITFY